MKMMTTMVVALVASTGGAHADDLAAKVAKLEARVKVLEEENAKYRDALVFLQKAYEQQKQQQDALDRDVPAEGTVFAVPVAGSIKQGQWEGTKDAPVTIVMAFDLADPYSRRSHPVLQELVTEYAGKLRIVYKNMVVHPQAATTAHQAACAASLQGKFPAFLTAYWKDGFDAYASARDTTKLGAPAMVGIAKSLKLDVARFEKDMASPACTKRISDDMSELSAFHVNATPTFYVNGKVITGAMPKETFKTAIDERLKAVTASKVPAAQYYDREVLAKGEKTFKSKKDSRP